MPPDELMERSDTVVVAKVISNGQKPDLTRFTVLTVNAVLKGKPRDAVSVWTVLGVPETDFTCCKIDDEYVLFLQRGDNDMYVPTNGKQSFVPIKAQ